MLCTLFFSYNILWATNSLHKDQKSLKMHYAPPLFLSPEFAVDCIGRQESPPSAGQECPAYHRVI